MERGMNFRDFLRHCSENWDLVVYVMGNHEHYHGRFDRTVEIMRRETSQYKNLHLLDKQSVTYDGVKFIGATLWTDLNRDCPITDSTLRSYMNDYKIIQILFNGTYRKLNPYDTFREHRATLEYLDKESVNCEKVVVCTHHAPSMQSISPRFANQYYMNGGYCSALDEFMLDRPQIKLWTHGHVHSNHDYMVGETRVVCNPRGYNDENPEFNSDTIFEVS
jgi:Icc-related predicted phosphoesterase